MIDNWIQLLFSMQSSWSFSLGASGQCNTYNKGGILGQVNTIHHSLNQLMFVYLWANNPRHVSWLVDTLCSRHGGAMPNPASWFYSGTHPDRAIVKIPILAAAEMQPEINDQQPKYSFRTWPLHRRILCLLASRDWSCEHHNASLLRTSHNYQNW